MVVPNVSRSLSRSTSRGKSPKFLDSRAFVILARMRVKVAKVTVSYEAMRRQSAQKQYEKGFFRYVLTRAIAFGQSCSFSTFS
jgi:hypothetical protein